MGLDNKIKQEIENYLYRWIDDLLTRKESDYKTQSYYTSGKIKPFHKALLSVESIRMSDFERSFSTALGLTYEECASIIAKSKFNVVKKQNELVGKIPTDTNAEIDRIITKINKGKIFTNYLDEITRLIKFAKTDTSKLVDKSIISDLYVEDKTHKIFFEIKTPKPNKEQCLNITRKHLWIHCITQSEFPNTQTYFGMPYNPYGENNKYTHAFSTKYLNVENQVLLGKQFWDFLGGSGAYEDLLSIYHHIGKNKANTIKNILKIS